MLRPHSDVEDSDQFPCEIAWSPDGKYIAIQRIGTTLIYETRKGKQVQKGQKGIVPPAGWAWKPSFADTQLQSRVVAKGVHGGSWHDDFVVRALSPNGRYLASIGSGWSTTVSVDDVQYSTNVCIYYGHADVSSWHVTDMVRAIAWSPDGKYIASVGSERTIHVWEALSGIPVLSYNGHVNTYNPRDSSENTRARIAWSPDGKLIASAAMNEKYIKFLHVWEAPFP